MANAILNFHFDFLTPSLSWGIAALLLTEPYLTQGSCCRIYPRQPWQRNVNNFSSSKIYSIISRNEIMQFSLRQYVCKTSCIDFGFTLLSQQILARGEVGNPWWSSCQQRWEVRIVLEMIINHGKDIGNLGSQWEYDGWQKNTRTTFQFSKLLSVNDIYKLISKLIFGLH